MRLILRIDAVTPCENQVMLRVAVANLASKHYQVTMHVHRAMWNLAFANTATVSLDVVTLDDYNDYNDTSARQTYDYGYNGTVYYLNDKTGTMGISCGGLLVTFQCTRDTHPPPWVHFSVGDHVAVRLTELKESE